MKINIAYPCGLTIALSTPWWSNNDTITTIVENTWQDPNDFLAQQFDVGNCPLHGKTCPKKEAP